MSKRVKTLKMSKTTLMINQAMGVTSTALITSALCYSSITTAGVLEEIIVTATKREASIQDIPVSVTAIGQESLDQLNVNNFTDYLLQLPGVTAGGVGPGQSTIYIRGMASTTPNITVAGVAGIAPNVALYLDEQSVTQVGRNLDVYAADLNRVEVLAGPQGTLFGASSQAGTVRLITNKPNLEDHDGRVEVGLSSTDGGESSEKIEAMINIPIIENKFAIRGVLYSDDQGGYIDNVPGRRDVSSSARFSPAGTRSNGVPTNAGFQPNADLSGATLNVSDNSALVEDDFNDAKYTGIRLSALYEVNDDWSVLAAYTSQKLKTEGAFFFDPSLDDSDELSIQRYTPDELEDSFDNIAITVKGRIGALEAVYTGSFLEREAEQLIDYTDYLVGGGQYLPYYVCDFSVTYPGAGGPSGLCGEPAFSVDAFIDESSVTQEIRFNTSEENRLRATFGGYYSDQELLNRVNYVQPGAARNFPANLPLPSPDNSLQSARPIGVTFFNDVTRIDEQYAFFGEASYDLTDEFELTLGARHYNIEVDFKGTSNSAFGNHSSAVDTQQFGSNLSTLFDGNQVVNGIAVPDKAVSKGEIYKASLAWKPSDNSLYYATYSEGFRPGLLNRPVGAGGVVPAVVGTDDVTNYEVGWKLDLLDNSLRFNGSVFYAEIEGMQSNVFDSTITILNFSDNAVDSKVSGIESDFTWAPNSVNGLTILGAFSLLDTEIKKILTDTAAVAPAGSDLSYAPNFQGNLRARYEWKTNGGYVAHVMPQVTYSDSSFSDIILLNRAEQDSYTLFNLSLGIAKDKWAMTVYADNLTDERAELNNFFNFAVERITVNRPRTFGVRFAYDFY